MTKAMKISFEKLSAICTLRGEGYSLAQIGKKLNVPKIQIHMMRPKIENLLFY